MMFKTRLACFAVVSMVMAAAFANAADVPAPLIDAYLKVQTELAGDQLQPAIEGAKTLSSEAAKAGESADKVRAAADKLVAAKTIEGARTAFGELSDTLIALLGGKAGGDLNVVACPMNKKSWVQKGEAIRNPYFGKSMLTCGEIKK